MGRVPDCGSGGAGSSPAHLTERDTIGGRLKWAIHRAHLSVREFQRRLADQKVRGSSYANIHRYLSNGRTPTIPFMEAASTVLGVRMVWLATGDGNAVEGFLEGISRVIAQVGYEEHLLHQKRLQVVALVSEEALGVVEEYVVLKIADHMATVEAAVYRHDVTEMERLGLKKESFTW